MSIPKVRVVEMQVADLKPAPYNPRKISKTALAGLERSVERFGLVQPIIVNERTGNVVGGHQRLKVLKKARERTASVVVVDLDDTDERALNLTLNNPGTQGLYDGESLRPLLDELNASNAKLMEDLALNSLADTLGDEKVKQAVFEYATRFEIVVTLEDEKQQRELYEQLKRDGYKVKAMQA